MLFTTCEKCGMPLDGGTYVQPWEDEDNEDGYRICPYCKHKNIEYSDDD